jgi:hypothetical protein
MSEAAGICVTPIYKFLSDPSEAPKPFMVAMASEDDQLHYFMDREQLAEFASGILKMICDG